MLSLPNVRARLPEIKGSKRSQDIAIAQAFGTVQDALDVLAKRTSDTVTNTTTITTTVDSTIVIAHA